jgi:hypothetical protein
MGSTHTQQTEYKETNEYKQLDKPQPSTPKSIKKQVTHKDSVLFYLKMHPVMTEKENEKRKKKVWNNMVNTVCSH